MINKSLKKGIPAIVALAFFTGLFAAGICLAGDDADTSNDSNVEVPKRAQEAITKADALSDAEKEKAEAVKKQQYLDNFHDETSSSLLTKEEIAKFDKERKEREQTIRDRAELETAPAAPEAEQPQPAGFNPPPARKGLPPVANSPGTVTGIVLYMGKGAALVLGNVVREGDVVRGNKVNKITTDYVEFEKQGNIWKQQVGQAPPPGLWEKPNNQQTGAAKKQETKQKK